MISRPNASGVIPKIRKRNISPFSVWQRRARISIVNIGTCLKVPGETGFVRIPGKVNPVYRDFR